MGKKQKMNFFKKLLNLFTNKKSKEIESLKKELEELKITKIEDYIGERLLIDSSNGFQIKFLGETIVKILAKCFWILVKDSDNYLVFTFKDYEKNEGVDVILVKEGHLTPMEKLEELEKENRILKQKLGEKND
jgi:hypothetical protein